MKEEQLMLVKENLKNHIYDMANEINALTDKIEILRKQRLALISKRNLFIFAKREIEKV